MHLHEKIDFTATVYIVHEDRVLLRMHEKYHIWLPPGGHIELHEDPIEAALREVKEETGLEVELVGSTESFNGDVKSLLPPRFLNRMAVKPGHEHIDMIYFAKSLTWVISPDDSEQQTEIKWFVLGELSDTRYNIPKHIQHYAAEALALLRNT